MNSRLIIALAVAAAAVGFAGVARAQPNPGAAVALACAAGYHVYRDGSCQPDNMYVDSRCPAGFVTQPFPNGQDYRCVPQSWSSGSAYPE